MMQTTKFKLGNVVRLKSGGPAMTINNLPQGYDMQSGRPASQYTCIWFEDDIQASSYFDENALDLVKD